MAATEAAVTIPEISGGPGGGGCSGGTFTVGEAVRANGEVRLGRVGEGECTGGLRLGPCYLPEVSSTVVVVAVGFVNQSKLRF